MVALVNNHVSVFGHKILDLSLTMQALNNRYVYSSSSFGFAATDLANLVYWILEKNSKPFPPLVEQLLAVHHHQCVGLAFRNQPCRHCRLAKRGRRADEPVVMGRYLHYRFLLGRPQSPVKLSLNRHTCKALVSQDRFDSVSFNKSKNFTQATARQGNMACQILSAGDDARFVESR